MASSVYLTNPFSAGTGYPLLVGSAAFNPADATVYYAGALMYSAPSAAGGFTAIRAPHSGIVTGVYLTSLVLGTLGSTENVSVAVVNSTQATSEIVTASLQWTAVGQTAENAAMSLPVTAGDLLDVAYTTPTWVTNPTTVLVWASIWIQTV